MKHLIIFLSCLSTAAASQGHPDDRITEIRGLLFDHRLFGEVMERKFAGAIENIYNINVLYNTLYKGRSNVFRVFFSARLPDGTVHENFSCIGRLYADGYEPPLSVSIERCKNPRDVILDGDLTFAHHEFGLRVAPREEPPSTEGTTEIRGIRLDHDRFADAMLDRLSEFVQKVYDVEISYENLYREHPDMFTVSFSLLLVNGSILEDFSCDGETYLDGYIDPPFFIGIDPCETPDGIALNDSAIIFDFAELGMRERRVIISPLEEQTPALFPRRRRPPLLPACSSPGRRRCPVVGPSTPRCPSQPPPPCKVGFLTL